MFNWYQGMGGSINSRLSESYENYSSFTLYVILAGKTELKYKYPSTEGYGLITPDPDDLTLLTIDVLREDTLSWKAGDIGELELMAENLDGINIPIDRKKAFTVVQANTVKE